MAVDQAMDVPEFNGALVDKIVEQSDAQANGFSIRELERIRDDNLRRHHAGASRTGRRAAAGAPARC